MSDIEDNAKDRKEDARETEPEKTKEKPVAFTKLILIFESSLLVFSLFFLGIGLKVFLGIFLMGSFLFFLVLTLISLFKRNLRTTFWLPIVFMACIMSLIIFIVVVNIPFVGTAAQETNAEGVSEKNEVIEEDVKKENIEEVLPDETKEQARFITKDTTKSTSETVIKSNTETTDKPKTKTNTETETNTESKTETETLTKTSSNFETAVCIRVIDGDTIEIRDQAGKTYKVRYIGIDTPEKGDPYFNEATQANSSLVLNKELRLEKDVSETDKYGRLLRYVYVGDLFVNAHLVAEGFAQISTYPPDVKYADYFLELQRQAREQGKGLWGITEQGQAQTQEQEKQQTQEQQQTRQQSYGIEVISLTSPIKRGSQASITIKTAPNVLCTITVYYKSGPSEAQGLGPKNSDANGNCTWSWKVGTRTTPGNWKIVITAGGVVQIETYFTVTE